MFVQVLPGSFRFLQVLSGFFQVLGSCLLVTGPTLKLWMAADEEELLVFHQRVCGGVSLCLIQETPPLPAGQAGGS